MCAPSSTRTPEMPSRSDCRAGTRTPNSGTRNPRVANYTTRQWATAKDSGGPGRALPRRGGLGRGLLRPVAVQAPVGALGGEELVVGALLDDPAVLQHHDPARLADRRQAVGDDDRGAPGEQPPQAG